MLQRHTINEHIARDPEAFIRNEIARYRRQVEALAQRLCGQFSGRCVVLLSGPSASGKTTTAAYLQQTLRTLGRQAFTVSLDDFYLGRGKAPRLPDGSFDYETVEALDLSLLQHCMDELLEKGRTLLPVFDFHAGQPKAEKRPLTAGENSFVIFEGIHALHPRLEEHLTGDTRFKILINAAATVYDGERPLLADRDIRLMRRLVRDARFRNSPPDNTLDMWRQVVRGEDLYLFPYAHTADATFDTTHAFEPGLMRQELLPLLQALPADSPFIETARRLAAALEEFRPLSPALLPADCLLREFVG